MKRRGYVGALGKVIDDGEVAYNAGDAKGVAAADAKETAIGNGTAKQVSVGGRGGKGTPRAVRVADTPVVKEGDGGAMPKGASRRGNKRGG